MAVRRRIRGTINATVKLIADTFNRANGSLGSTDTGAVPWQVITGTWTISANKASTSTSTSSDPVAVVESARSNGQIDLTAGLQDGIYFRVVDANNWWRALFGNRQEAYYNSATSYRVNCSGSCSGTGAGCSSFVDGICGSCSYSGCVAAGECGGGCCNCSGSGCSAQSTCSVFGGYTYYRRIHLQSRNAGTISTVATSSETSSSPSDLRVVLAGTSIVATSPSVGLSASTTSSVHQTATKHGIGRGSVGDTSGINIDNFSFAPS